MKYYERMNKIRQEISNLGQELSQLKKNCPHERTTAKLSESFAFDNTPRRVCVDCDSVVGELTEDEVKALYKEELEDLWERKLSDDEVSDFFNKHPRGYNY